MMPGMDGYEVCRRLKGDSATRGIPVIFLTGASDARDEMKGFELGAVDYLTKPVSMPVVRALIDMHLKLNASADSESKTAYLQLEIARRTLELGAIQDVTALVASSLAETRDSDTGAHIRRTQFYVRALAEKLRSHKRFSALLDDRMIRILFRAAPLHDIGKIGIPEYILLKPGRLDPAEFEIMKTHTTLGLQAIEQAERRLGTAGDFFRVAKEIAYSHQEKWDGSGYPEGLSGEEIPFGARLMAVADVYDALMSRRVYKLPYSHKDAANRIRDGRGRHFDPDIVDAFLDISDEIAAIAQRCADDDAERRGQGAHRAP